MKNILTTLALFLCLIGSSQNLVNANNWQRVPVPLKSVQKLYFWSADSGFAYGNTNEAKLVRTYDGGLTWKTIFDITQITGSQIYTCPIHIRSKNEVGLAFWDADSFLNFIKTTDGGNTWENHKGLNKIFSSCYDMIYNGDTVAIASSERKFTNDGVLYYAIQYSISNCESIVREVRYGCYINFKQVVNNNIYILNANSRKQQDGIEINNAFSSFRFGYDLNNDKVDLAAHNWAHFNDYGYFDYFPNYNDIDHGFEVTTVGKLKKYPINDLPSDSFYYDENTRTDENKYQAFCMRGPRFGYCIDNQTVVISTAKNVFTVNGNVFSGGHLNFANETDMVTCITFGNNKTGYLGTNNDYIFKNTKGGELVNGIKETNNFSFKVYPNPSISSIFQLEFPDNAEYFYTLNNTLGRIVEKGNCNTNKIINLASLSKGIYFLTAYDNQNRQSCQKILVR